MTDFNVVCIVCLFQRACCSCSCSCGVTLPQTGQVGQAGQAGQVGQAGQQGLQQTPQRCRSRRAGDGERGAIPPQHAHATHAVQHAGSGQGQGQGQAQGGAPCCARHAGPTTASHSKQLAAGGANHPPQPQGNAKRNRTIITYTYLYLIILTEQQTPSHTHYATLAYTHRLVPSGPNRLPGLVAVILKLPTDLSDLKKACVKERTVRRLNLST